MLRGDFSIIEEGVHFNEELGRHTLYGERTHGLWLLSTTR